MFATSLLCSTLLTFCPVLVRDAFAGDVAHFSVAVSAFGFGGLLAAGGLLAIDPRRDRRPFASGFAIAFARVVVAVALDPSAWALPLLFTMAGAAMTRRPGETRPDCLQRALRLHEFGAPCSAEEQTMRLHHATLPADELRDLDAHWRAANYLAVGQMYLCDNPPLKRPLLASDVKRPILGHWGTAPGRTSSMPASTASSASVTWT